jgi:hypothetical protein
MAALGEFLVSAGYRFSETVENRGKEKRAERGLPL